MYQKSCNSIQLLKYKQQDDFGGMCPSSPRCFWESNWKASKYLGPFWAPSPLAERWRCMPCKSIPCHLASRICHQIARHVFPNQRAWASWSAPGGRVSLAPRSSWMSTTDLDSELEFPSWGFPTILVSYLDHAGHRELRWETLRDYCPPQVVSEMSLSQPILTCIINCHLSNPY